MGEGCFISIFPLGDKSPFRNAPEEEGKTRWRSKEKRKRLQSLIRGERKKRKGELVGKNKRWFLQFGKGKGEGVILSIIYYEVREERHKTSNIRGGRW